MKAKRLLIVVATALVLAVVLASSAYGRPDATTGSAAGGPATATEATGFAWVDAAIGAGLALGVVALAAGTVYVGRRRASHPPLPSH